MALTDKVTQFNSDADLVHQIVHGDASTVVQTEGGAVKSVAKLLADSQAEIDAQATLGANLAATGGAALVGTKDGSSVQAKLDALGGGSVKSVNGTAPDAGGNVTLTSDAVAEGQGNQYFTLARVLASALQGLDTSKNAVITAADTVLSSLGKLQKQISDWIAAKDASSGYPGLTLFKINFKNAANTLTSFLTNVNTAVRTYTFPDKDGTVAMLSDIPVSGSMVLLGQATVSTAVSSINFLNLFSSSYDKYVIEIENFSSSSTTAADTFNVRLAKAGAVDSGGVYANNAPASTGTGIVSVAAVNSSFALQANKLAGTFTIRDANSPYYKPLDFIGSGYNGTSNNQQLLYDSIGMYATTTPATGFSLYFTSGNIIAGTVRVYGIKNS